MIGHRESPRPRLGIVSIYKPHDALFPGRPVAYHMTPWCLGRAVTEQKFHSV